MKKERDWSIVDNYNMCFIMPNIELTLLNITKNNKLLVSLLNLKLILALECSQSKIYFHIDIILIHSMQFLILCISIFCENTN